MSNYDAPHVNGVLELSASKQDTLKKQLIAIRDAFVPTPEQPVADTFYMVVEHTKKHGAQTTFTQLNGDTCEYLLSLAEQPEQGV